MRRIVKEILLSKPNNCLRLTLYLIIGDAFYLKGTTYHENGNTYVTETKLKANLNTDGENVLVQEACRYVAQEWKFITIEKHFEGFSVLWENSRKILALTRGDSFTVESKQQNDLYGFDIGVEYLCTGMDKGALVVENKYGEVKYCSPDKFAFKEDKNEIPICQ